MKALFLFLVLIGQAHAFVTIIPYVDTRPIGTIVTLDEVEKERVIKTPLAECIKAYETKGIKASKAAKKCIKEQNS